MQLKNPDADVFVPDESSLAEALAKTTHLAVGAHQDDIEFMALHGILSVLVGQTAGSAESRSPMEEAAPETGRTSSVPTRRCGR